MFLCFICPTLSPCLSLFISQDVVLMRALRDMNLPKFVFEDVPLFLGLISDLFPGLDCPRVRYPSFNDAVEDILEENRYVMIPNQVKPLVTLMTQSITAFSFPKLISFVLTCAGGQSGADV